MQNGIFFLCASDDKEGLIYDFKKIEKSNALFFCVYETRDFPSFELENALSNFFIAFVPFTDIQPQSSSRIEHAKETFRLVALCNVNQRKKILRDWKFLLEELFKSERGKILLNDNMIRFTFICEFELINLEKIDRI